MAIFSTLAAIGTTAWSERDRIADAFGGGDDTVAGDCPGQASIRDGLRRAFANAPQDAMLQFRSDVRRICTDPDWPCYAGWNDPVVMARAATGGHDCEHSSNSRQFVPLVDSFISQWGQRQEPSTSWQTTTYGGTAPARSSVAPDALPGGSPLGVPVWAWLALGVAVLALILNAGDLSL